ncbi:glycosyltransferase [Pleomorphochaeta sp. DL1XJH-081]|uniref:glycosyltransferase n=1 Tax=Pleomorphochaeta sp. DL1XJH-081 TaxID=3409690 RepID=UPI003BB5E541
MDRLSIGQFSDAFPPLMDGVGFVVKNYTELLLERGHDTHAIVSGSMVDEGEQYDREQGIDYTIRSSMIPVPGINPYGLVVKNMEFRKKVGELSFDIIHTHSPFFLGRFAEQFTRHKRIPLVSTFHSLYKDDFYGFTHSHMMSEHLTRMILRHYRVADEVWTPTEWSKRKLRDYGFDGKIEVVENGCDFPLPSDSEYSAYRKAGLSITQVPQGVPTLIYVGQLKKEKNLELLIEALDIAHKRHVNFHMIFVGTGPDRHHFEEMIEEAYLTPHVTFTGKITDRERLKSLLAVSTLFLFPSQYDTSALVLREAAALQLPLLNTRGSSTAGITTDGYNGYIARNTAESYADRLQQILADPRACKKAGVAAQKTLYRSWNEVLDEVESRYRALVDQKSSPMS